ncbi:tail fiber assembly protein [Salmonella enterica]|nr:tail fiber assembly protein [Salmonella enterica]ECK6020018.1 tail fiber assembly protein [Salmonella enterica]ECL5719690.1 tail fiber assembly protein [Salmonella enterica]EGN6248792.1 tail fiber assembly protein [Salmonella enterica]ELB8049279.1 tail fiber assembly protein [Salmonella enterica]
MQNIKHFTPYEPESPAFPGAAYLKSEDGQDWYECQKRFADETLKFTYDDNGVITCITRDVSGLWPYNRSVAEVPDTEENRRADISGGWQFKDGKIVQRVYSPEELHKKAEAEKVRRLAEAESAIAPLARAVKLKIATDEEIKRLDAWELYSVMVNRVDTSSPDWPEVPGVA